MDVLTYDMLIISPKISDSMHETWIIYHVYVYHTLTPNVAIIQTDKNRALILLPLCCARQWTPSTLAIRTMVMPCYSLNCRRPRIFEGRRASFTNSAIARKIIKI
jgi:hypothetical protein